jgi:glycosyltransferase involved in cell wall biosynthesis
LLKERGIPTVLDQDYKNFELIIIGDCCTDNTEEVVSSFNDSRIKFYNIPYRKKRYPNIVELHWLAGPVIAANEALTRVQGTWIARLDDDDLWSKDHLSSLLNFAQNGDFEFVSAQSTSIRYGEESIVHGVGALDPYYTQKDAPPGVPNPKIGATQTWLYRSYLKLFRYNIDCWRKSWNKVNDLDIGYRIYLAGARIGYLEKVVASIIPRPGEQTVGIDAYKQDSSSKLEHYKF